MRSIVFSVAILTTGLSVASLYSGVIQFSSVAGNNPREAFKNHVLKRTRPVIVKFSTSRCPCSSSGSVQVSTHKPDSVVQSKPVQSSAVTQTPKSTATSDKKLAALAHAFPRITFIELNSAAYQEIAKEQGVKLEVPTLVYYNKGKAVHREAYSTMSVEELKRSIKTHLVH